ncbi:MAG: EAL domain-containing protein, partial [Burkholderiaceae bacterium]|nr:EAL domain-containing protein [Burkholderiaceae bacterium]
PRGLAIPLEVAARQRQLPLQRSTSQSFRPLASVSITTGSSDGFAELPKIDQSFVHKMMVNRSDGAVVQTIVSLAKHLAIEVIAEGVETAEQHAFLEAMGCRLFQGYLYGAPVPSEEFADVLATSHSRRSRPTAERVAVRA